MSNTEFDGDWLGRLMEDANKKAPARPAQLSLPTDPVVPQVVQPYQQPQTDNYEAFIGKYFMLDAISRECHYAYRNGAMDVFWLRASGADHHPGFVFDSDPLHRQRLLNALNAGEDVSTLGNLNTKPR